jgi:hypothetical protein
MPIPQSTISSLSSGRNCRMAADEPHQKIRLKKFHCEIINRPSKTEKPIEWKELPQMEIDKQTVLHNYLQIKKDIQHIIDGEMERMVNDPILKGLITRKE